MDPLLALVVIVLATVPVSYLAIVAVVALAYNFPRVAMAAINAIGRLKGKLSSLSIKVEAKKEDSKPMVIPPKKEKKRGKRRRRIRHPMLE